MNNQARKQRSERHTRKVYKSSGMERKSSSSWEEFCRPCKSRSAHHDEGEKGEWEKGKRKKGKREKNQKLSRQIKSSVRMIDD